MSLHGIKSFCLHTIFLIPRNNYCIQSTPFYNQFLLCTQWSSGSAGKLSHAVLYLCLCLSIWLLPVCKYCRVHYTHDKEDFIILQCVISIHAIMLGGQRVNTQGAVFNIEYWDSSLWNSYVSQSTGAETFVREHLYSSIASTFSTDPCKVWYLRSSHMMISPRPSVFIHLFIMDVAYFLKILPNIVEVRTLAADQLGFVLLVTLLLWLCYVKTLLDPLPSWMSYPWDKYKGASLWENNMHILISYCTTVKRN